MNVKEIAVKTTTKLSNNLGRAGLKIKKYSPEILVVVGTTSVITGFVLGCKATLKAEEVLDKHEEEMDVVAEAREHADDYSETDYKKDILIVYTHTAGRFVKLYAPGVGFTILGIGCYLGSYGILKKRNVALMAAYKILETSFSDYRKRVVNELGAEKDLHFLHGATDAAQDSELAQKAAEKNEALEGIVLPGGKTPSMYAKFFDETSTEWTRSAETNKMILNARQNWANDLLNSRGYLFLNEVYQMLGMEVTKAGQVVGWIKNNPNGGDNYVDFGMFNVYRGLSDEPMRKFHNGYEKSILLDFNVDGVIWDMI